jgi:hypothetical protein
MTTNDVVFQHITAHELVTRGLSQRGRGRYRLSAGAIWTADSAFSNDHNLVPADEHSPDGYCDCTGLGAWAEKRRRGRWNTDAIVHDALGDRTHYRVARGDEVILPGMLLVKPGPDLDHDGHRDHPGHYSIIAQVHDWFVRGLHDWWTGLGLVHCSGALQDHIDPATGHRYGAVRLTDASMFHSVGYIIVPLHVDFSPEAQYTGTP